MLAKKKVALVTLAAVLTMVMLGSQFAGAFKIDLGSILKVGGSLLVVDKLGPQINSFINKVYNNNGVKIQGMTKVVPIISLGDGAYLGAVQVVGPAAAVKKCTACVQVESTGIFGSDVRIQAFVPVSQRGVTNIKRIQGVAVSAIVDIKL